MIGILGLRVDERSRLEWMQDSDADFRSAWPHMEWPAQIGRRSGNWLNAELGQPLPRGDVEGREAT